MPPVIPAPVHQQMNNFVDRPPIQLQGKPRHHELHKHHKPHKHFMHEYDRRIEYNHPEKVHPQPID